MFFFFQAEDGIRDIGVTGVQTCALPISEDVDVAMLYDAFTINPILFLEDLGFCEKGEGGTFVEGGRIAPGGELPVNTNGGGLSYNHPGMYGLLLVIEALRQRSEERRVGKEGRSRWSP